MKPRLSLPLADWPAPHREAMQLATKKGGSSKYSRAANWRKYSAKGPERAWGQWLMYRMHIALPIDCDPVATIHIDELRGFVDALYARVRLTTASDYFRDMGEALRVMRPDRSVKQVKILRAISADLAAAAKPLPDLDTVRVGSSEIFEAACREMDQLWDDAHLSWRKAIDYRDALMVAIIVTIGVRRGTLRETAENGSEVFGNFLRLNYARASVKTKKKLIRTLPSEITRYVEHGFELARLLAARKGKADTGFLLVTRLGKQISRDWITKRVSGCTKRLVDVALSPQKLRRQCATSISANRPEKSYLATESLQHYDRQETEGYNKSSGLPEALAYDDIMENMYGDDVALDSESRDLRDGPSV